MSTKKQREQSIIKPLAAAFLTAEPDEEPVVQVKPQPKRQARSVGKPVEIKIGELSKEETRAMLREQLVSGVSDGGLLSDDDLFYDDEVPFDEPLDDIENDLEIERKFLKTLEKKSSAQKVSAKKETDKKAPAVSKAPEKKADTKKEAANKEAIKKESIKKEAAKKESAKKGEIKKEAPKKETAKKEEVKKDSVKKDSVKKDSAVKESPKTKPAEKENALKKFPEKKAAEKNVTEKKAPVKKETVKEVPDEKKSSGPDSELNIEYAGVSYSAAEIKEKALKVWTGVLKRGRAELRTMKLYIKPQEKTVYYVFNDKRQGSFKI